MIKSMTGYGRNQETVSGRDITVEIKSVNHRYFEFSSRVTRGYGFLEDKLKSYVQTMVSRGKVDVYVSIVTVDEVASEVSVNHSLAAGYLNALNELSEKYGVRNDISVSGLSRYPDIFSVHKAPDDEDEIYNAVISVAEVAVKKFITMREAEGGKLQEDILGRAGYIMDCVSEIEKRSPDTVREYIEKLTGRMKELLNGTLIEEQRILTEAAIYADKIAVAEETVRLRSHFDQMKDMLHGDEAVGRKLDFLMQEMNREINTVGSKAQNIAIAGIVVDVKAELEKIREQIQNIE